MHVVREDPDLKHFYRRKPQQKELGKARFAAGRKLGIRLYIMFRHRDQHQGNSVGKQGCSVRDRAPPQRWRQTVLRGMTMAGMPRTEAIWMTGSPSICV